MKAIDVKLIEMRREKTLRRVGSTMVPGWGQ
jgi:hypothetical protein